MLEFLVGGWWWHEANFGVVGNIFCIPAFENVSPGDGSQWIKETLCCKSRMEIYFSLVFMIFYFSFCFLLYFMC